MLPPLLVLLVELNPYPSEYVLLAVYGSTAVVIGTGMEGAVDAAATKTLLCATCAGTSPKPTGKATAAVF